MGRIVYLCLIFIFLSSIISVNHGYSGTTNVIILLDASASMGERLGQTTKMTIARSSIKNVLRSLPDSVRVGLRAFGHQSPYYLRDCQDTRLVVPLDTLNYQDFVQKLDRIQPGGYSPLAYSLECIKDDFLYSGTNVVICITDGIETCGGNPCAAADSLKKSSIATTVHIIGVNVSESDQDALMCIPKNTEGGYFSADNPNELDVALADALALSISPGYVRLDFRGLSGSRDFIIGNLLFPNNRNTFQYVTTKVPAAMAAGNYRITNFQIWSMVDPHPYCPENLMIDSIKIVKDQVTIVPLNQLSILHASVKHVKDLSKTTPTLIIYNHNNKHKVPNHRIETDNHFVLIHPGTYDISCYLSNSDSIHYQNQVLLPQGVHLVEFNFGIKWKFLAWLKFLLVIPIILILKLLKNFQLSFSASKSKAEKFARHPEQFHGKVVTLDLIISEKDKGCGKNILFWIYYPVEVNIAIFVPHHFRKLKKFDTRYKIRVTFRCKTGQLSKGNILLSFKRGSKI